MVIIVTITIMVAVITEEVTTMVAKTPLVITTAIKIIKVVDLEVAMVILVEIKLQHRSETSKCSRTQHVIKLTTLALHSNIYSRCKEELNRAMMQSGQLKLKTTQATTPNTMAIKLQREPLQVMYKVELLSTTTGSIISMTRVPLPQLQPPQPNNNKQHTVTTTISNTTTTTTDSSMHLNTGQPVCTAQLRLHKLQPCSSQVIIIRSLLNRQTKATKITTRRNESSIEV